MPLYSLVIYLYFKSAVVYNGHYLLLTQELDVPCCHSIRKGFFHPKEWWVQMVQNQRTIKGTYYSDRLWWGPSLLGAIVTFTEWSWSRLFDTTSIHGCKSILCN